MASSILEHFVSKFAYMVEIRNQSEYVINQQNECIMYGVASVIKMYLAQLVRKEIKGSDSSYKTQFLTNSKKFYIF